MFDAPGPLVFAHRGGARIGPENTLPGFARGMAAGADGFECDVRLSRDGQAVVIHDATLDRTTDCVGPVGALTAEELAGLDATCRFVSAVPASPAPDRAGVPTLAEVLRAFPGVRAIVELKDEHTALADAVAAVIRQAGAAQRVCLGSFHGRLLEHLRRVAPELTTSASLPEAKGTLVRSWLRWPRLTQAPYRAFQVPPMTGRLRVVTPAFVRQVHRERAVVQVWVVDNPDDATRLFEMGVDGVVSDRPDLTVPARERWMGSRPGLSS